MPDPVVNNGGGGDPFYQPYVGKLDKDTLGWLDGKKFGTVEDALKSGALADKMARERNVIARPDLSDPAKRGEWEGWGVLGWDADKAKYGAKIKAPEGHDPGLFDAFVGAAHELRAPPDIAQGLYERMNKRVLEGLSELASKGVKAQEEMHTALRGEWKDKYDVNLEIAKRAAKALKIGADDVKELTAIFGGDDGGKGSARLIKLLHNAGVGLKLEEGDNDIGLGGGGGGAMTPAAAMAEIRRLNADPEFIKVIKDSRHAQYADYQAKYEQLAAIAAKDPDWQKKLKGR